MAKLQSVAFGVAVVCAVLGLFTSTGCPVLPEGDTVLVVPLHLLVILVGAAAGLAIPFRARRIDEERWRLVQDPDLTSGERQYAHKEADGQKKSVGIVFVMAPLTLGFWMASHFRNPATITAADFLTVTPLAGFAAGLGLGWWLTKHKAPPGE
ncbi:MAG: hypothetical protein VYE73_14160 [Acidobacteriota bacterium]|nr:hypothetical protein [Acidobacteriota bacterium]